MSGGTRTLRYQKAALRRDYLRVGAGLVMSVLLLLLVSPCSIAFYIVSAFGATFLAYGAHTYVKQSTVIEIDDQGATRRFSGVLRQICRTQHIAFVSLDRFSLHYYGRRQDRGKGIVELTIGVGKARFTADQALEAFDELVKTARQAARTRGIELDPATEANLGALGYR